MHGEREPADRRRGSRTARPGGWAALLLAVWLTGCGGPPQLRRWALTERPLLDLYLIGDAGKPAPGGEPVLQAAQALIEREGGEHALVIYLGDNVYPDGLPDSTAADRVEKEDILRAQMEVALSTGAAAIFVPGNHDWDHSGPEGLERVRLQAEFLEVNGAPRIEMLPDDGCPGPVVRDLGEHLRLVALDTQWWLHRYERPEGEGSPCAAKTESAALEQIRTALRTAGARSVLVVAHHPMISGGAHGLFPLLPERFSPWPRFSAQDLGHPRYRELRRSLYEAFAECPPLIYAAGHEHSLQVLRGGGAVYTLISGTGVYNHTTRVRPLAAALYAREASGFMRLSVLREGRLRLAVVVVAADGSFREDYSTEVSSGEQRCAEAVEPAPQPGG